MMKQNNILIFSFIAFVGNNSSTALRHRINQIFTSFFRYFLLIPLTSYKTKFLVKKIGLAFRGNFSNFNVKYMFYYSH